MCRRQVTPLVARIRDMLNGRKVIEHQRYAYFREDDIFEEKKTLGRDVYTLDGRGEEGGRAKGSRGLERKC